MTTPIEALKHAIIVLKQAYITEINNERWVELLDKTIDQCKSAISELEKAEPVGIININEETGNIKINWSVRTVLKHGDLLYTSPDMFHPPATAEDMKIYQAIADNYNAPDTKD